MRRPPPRSTRTDSLFPYTTRFRSETGAMLAGLVRDPDHDVPIATLGGVLIAGVVYIVSSVLVMGIVPAAELDASSAPFALVAAETFGPCAALALAPAASLPATGPPGARLLVPGNSRPRAPIHGHPPDPYPRPHPKP